MAITDQYLRECSVQDAIGELMFILKNHKHDPEGAHQSADQVLLNVLEANGFGKVAQAWKKISKEIGFLYA